MSIENPITPYENREIIFYKTANGDIRVEVLLFEENIWLSQPKIAELFDVNKSSVTRHLKNIFESGELQEESVTSTLETTADDGKKYLVKYYNLDAVIAVGYRINSKKATMFRIWANRILKEFIIKGYVMDDERLKDPDSYFGKDYFEEQLERIRDIRASERRFYQKITDIYASCSADYDADSPITKQFYATVQNKLHYAVTHQTAAEIVVSRANSDLPNMGLTTWKNAPDGRIRKSDVSVAKNYLSESEISDLNEIVTMYLDYAERQARRGNVMYMKDWVERLDAFLKFNEEDILNDSGKVSAEVAKSFAETEYEKYRTAQDRIYESDFDKFLKETGAIEDSLKS
ncbi:MAG: virulence RhuM family protein [Oscillospiraceae bacterium]|nr:virulence RhuM family protein [Oscillospiraceae bacterium]